MRRRPILLGTLLIIVAFAIQINYDNQFKTFLSGQPAQPQRGQLPGAGGLNPDDVRQRLAATQGFSVDAYIRLSSYLIGALGVMSIIVGSAIPDKTAAEVS